MSTILFVEDERNLQKTFRDLLENEGYEVISALNGEEGFKKAKEENPDLILLDLILPKLHGFKVLKKLKAKEEIKDIPVIILTNLEGTDDVQKALEMGVTTYLVKSDYKLDEVLNKIEKSLED
ncbi:MAG: response regulator [Candidatus Paceibacterota bacterium]